jgi:hypothetical protein
VLGYWDCNLFERDVICSCRRAAGRIAQQMTLEAEGRKRPPFVYSRILYDRAWVLAIADRESTMRRRTASAGRVVRDGWLMIGLALLLYLGVEGLYRVQGAERKALPGD